MLRRGITVYTLFIIIVIALSLSFLSFIMIKLSKKIPEKRGKEFCIAKQKAYCLEWYSKGFNQDERPEGYDFSECKKRYGIEEPTLQTCKEIV